jgi:chitinase
VELQKDGGWTTVWDDQQKTPYMYKGNQWVGFDNPRSIGVKVEYAKSLNLGGVMIWSIETDDFKGIGGTKFPILKAIRQALGGISNENSDPEPEPVPEPDQSDSSQDAGTNTGNPCNKVGYVRDPVVCSKFYYCLSHNGGFVPIEENCNFGLVFDDVNIRCDYPELVNC